MFRLFTRWFQRNFSDPQAVILVMILLIGFSLIYALGNILAPVFIAVVLAYLLEWMVALLERRKIKRFYSVFIVFISFVGLFLSLTFGVLPILWEQLQNLVAEIPNMLIEGKRFIEGLPEKYPGFISEEAANKVANNLTQLFSSDSEDDWLQGFVSGFLESLKGIATWLVYIILVPFMVFFMMKDKDKIIRWFLRWLPKERHLSNSVWQEVNAQIGNYVRGKVVEIFVVGGVTFITFSFMELRFALLLSALVGLSVLIPYIGAAVVTLPIAIIAYFQWGFESQFVYVMIAYLIIQALDGNVLVPILFSEAVNLHPLAIIVAVLFFGGVWGFWGVFFAIPLATLVKAVLNAWDDVIQDGIDETLIQTTES